jgi:hypothetical protein
MLHTSDSNTTLPQPKSVNSSLNQPEVLNQCSLALYREIMLLRFLLAIARMGDRRQAADTGVPKKSVSSFWLPLHWKR